MKSRINPFLSYYILLLFFHLVEGWFGIFKSLMSAQREPEKKSEFQIIFIKNLSLGRLGA